MALETDPVNSYNPVVAIGNSIPLPGIASYEKTMYSYRNFYNMYKSWIWPTEDAEMGDNNPEVLIDDKRLPAVSPCDVVLFPTVQNYLEQNGYGGFSYQNSPDELSGNSKTIQDNFCNVNNIRGENCGFVTVSGSVLPALIAPTHGVLVDNTNDTNDNNARFLWSSQTAIITPRPFAATNSKFIQASQNLTNSSSAIEQTLTCEDNVQCTIPEDLLQLLSSKLENNDVFVGNGAFMITGCWRSLPQFQDIEKYITINCGDLTIKINSENKVSYTMTGNTDEMTAMSINIKETSSELYNHFQSIVGDNAFIFTVVPMWNGIGIYNCIPNDLNDENYPGVFIKKNNSKSIFSKDYDFDKKDSKDIEVKSDEYVKYNLGSKITVNFIGMEVYLHYTPLFFLPGTMWYYFFPSAKNIDKQNDTGRSEYTYDYSLYSVYCKNNLSASIEKSNIKHMVNPVLSDGEEYKAIKYTVNSSDTGSTKQFQRTAPELFGCYLKIIENKEFNQLRNNGNFELSFSGGDRGDKNNPGYDWTKYIQNISVNIGLDSASGSITVDKYGLAGQDAFLEQTVGAITITPTNAPPGCKMSTNAEENTIFSGLVWQIGESDNVSESSWTINLVSLQKKAEDMVLLAAPFFDGVSIKKTFKFLMNYCGTQIDDTYADWDDEENDIMPGSDDIRSPMINLTSGTAVKSAVDECLNNVSYMMYYDRFGKAKFYKLREADALPETFGPDRSLDYEDDEGVVKTSKIVDRNYNADFDNLRNMIMMVALKKPTQTEPTSNVKLVDLATEPLVLIEGNATSPDIPWMRGMNEAVPGIYDSEAQLLKRMLIRKADSKRYEWIGKITVPGNSKIEPYDLWTDNYYIINVTHNLDFVGKTWTTDLELAKILITDAEIETIASQQPYNSTT